MDTKALEDTSDAIVRYVSSLFEDKADELAKNSRDHEKVSRAYASFLDDLVKDLKKNGGALTNDQQRKLDQMHSTFQKGSLYVLMKNLAGFCQTSMANWEKAYKLSEKLTK